MNQNEEKINITSLTGYVDHFIYKVDTSTYTVFVLQTEGKDVTCVGHCRDLAEGETVEVTGEYVTNPMYGKQFSVKTYKVTPPTDKDSIERYLGSGAIKGIGASLAARIVKNFGEDTLRIMEEEPERLAEIKGISLKKAMDIGVQVLEKRI